jgi:hypothetical protein
MWQNEGPPMTTRQDAKAFGKTSGSSDPTLCLTCGLCCNGVLHTRTIVKPGEIESLRALGLTIEAKGDQLCFRQPCLLYREQRCSVYPNHPGACRAYQCNLLKKFLAGTITLEQGAHTIQRAHELVSAILEQMPVGYSFDQLKKEMEQHPNSGGGILGSAEMRQSNAEFLLTAAKLVMYARKHFGKPRKAKEGAA